MNQIVDDLIRNGYLVNEDTKVFQSPDFVDIAYNDGDETENRVLNIIKNATDLDSLSDELETYCTDWPSTYHLSKRRGNLLRPFVDDFKNKTILEIGSGMGPITRILGESNANVLALEGTFRRAYATRMRTRDLENVSVLAEKFDKFQTNLKFDVITLIGVLEYSNLYVDAEYPHAQVLGRCYEMLNPDGILIIAIENKLGLKYFAGANEDHVGIPMFGLENRYNSKSVRTFGRKELKELLSASGFKNLVFNVPLPDYKLTTSVISESGFNEKKFNSTDLIRGSFGTDPQLPATLAFTPELVLTSLSQNDLDLELANSFLVVAGKGCERIKPENHLAWHFSTNRLKAFCVETMFTKSELGEIVVLKSKMCLKKSNGPLTQKISEKNRYIEGQLLQDHFELLLSTPSWKHSDLLEILKSYQSFLLSYEKIPHSTTGQHLLLEESIDLIPRNIAISSDLKWNAFDAEWETDFPVDLRQIIFRAVLSLHTLSHFANDEYGNTYNQKSLFILFCRLLGLNIDEELISDFSYIEIGYQMSVTGYSENIEEFNTRFLSPLGRHKFQPYSVLINISERDRAVVERDRAVVERDRAVVERDSALAEFDSITNSTIWKLSAPYRKVKSKFWKN